MTLKLNRKRHLVLALIAALAIGVAAVAYWSNSGGGSSTATINGQELALTISDVVVDEDLVPGSVGEMKFNINNPNRYDVVVDAVKPATTDPIDPSATGCDASWFQYGDDAAADGTLDNLVTFSTPVVIQAGESHLVTTQAQMDESGTDQDDCKNSSITFNYKIDARP